MRSVVELLQLHEGKRLRPYRCPEGFLTIGYGHNLDAKPISERAAAVILEDDIQDVIRELETLTVFSRLDEVRRAVLIDMTFNLGFAGILGFKKMWKAIEAGNYERAADEMLNSKWARQVGRRAMRLSDMMRSGDWPL